jgi:2,4-dienoyl-CoA reductase-like NADH-dependent reductase (Old Yellow Enzyme family)
MSPQLFSPLTIRGVTLKNRVMVSPMNQYSARDGMAGDWHLAHLAQFATGGAGLVFLEATKVERRGLGSAGDLGLWEDGQIAPIRRIAEFLRREGAVSGVQLSHAGRKAGTMRPWEGFGPVDRNGEIEGQQPWPIIAPSPLPYLEGWPTPRAMTQEDIDRVVHSFARAAWRANEAGLDIIELHGGHGYLIHQFLSAASNIRTDRYGGSLDNRMRFALEVAQAVRREWPAGKPLFFRISAVDEGGWSLGDSVVLAQALKSLGVDAIDCSSAGINVRSVTLARSATMLGFQVPYAERVRREADIFTVAVGFIVKPQQAEAIIAAGRADIVALAREMLFDPSWAVHAARALGTETDFSGMPPQYGWWLARREAAGYQS